MPILSFFFVFWPLEGVSWGGSAMVARTIDVVVVEPQRRQQGVDDETFPPPAFFDDDDDDANDDDNGTSGAGRENDDAIEAEARGVDVTLERSVAERPGRKD